MYKENISAAYVLNTEIEEPSTIYDRDNKNKTEELDRLHAAMMEKLVTTSNTEKMQILTRMQILILIFGHEGFVLNTLEFQSI